MRIVIVLFFLSLLFTFYNNSGGRASVADSGNTGAPGDETILGVSRTCQTCHNSTEIQVGILIEMKDSFGQPVGSYHPGQSYTLEVRINSIVGRPQAYGFQMISLLDKDSSDVAGWSNPAMNVKIITTGNGRSYAEHKGPSSTNLFSVDWLAPAAGSGNVTFYSAGNGVNRNGDNTGDGAAVTTLSIPEEISTSIFESSPEQIHFFPNPATTFVIVDNLSRFEYWLVGAAGRIIKKGLSTGQIQLTDVPGGTYFLRIRDESGLESSLPLLIRK